MTLPKINDLSDDTIRVMCAEAMGFRVITLPILPAHIRLDSNVRFTDEAARQWHKVYPNGAIPKCIERYPIDANAALMLCAWMAEKHGWQFNATMHRKSRTWSVYFEQDEETHYSAIDQPTFALAVSRAFLIANHLAE